MSESDPASSRPTGAATGEPSGARFEPSRRASEAAAAVRARARRRAPPTPQGRDRRSRRRPRWNAGETRQPSSVSSYASSSSTKSPAAANWLFQPSTSSSRNQPWSPGSPRGTVTRSRRPAEARVRAREAHRRATRVGLRGKAVRRVVGADVLERRDEQRLVEGVVREGQRADVRRHALHPVDVPLGEVDADELDARAQQRGEVRHLGECVADFEHPAGRDEPREHPRDLDHALVARTRAPGATRGARRVHGHRARARRRRRGHARARPRRPSRARAGTSRATASRRASFVIARSRAVGRRVGARRGLPRDETQPLDERRVRRVGCALARKLRVDERIHEPSSE